MQVVTGEPIVTRATDMYRQMLSAAGVEGAEEATAPGPTAVATAFHVAVDDTGRVLGVILARLGSSTGLDPSMSIPRSAWRAHLRGAHQRGVPEGGRAGGDRARLPLGVLLRPAPRGRQLATILDPVTLALFRDDYAIAFRPLGPVVDDERRASSRPAARTSTAWRPACAACGPSSTSS